ncbi:MAG TPA: nitrous oxide reductase family maturation protein NosD [Anaerolineae bacterium]|nr:nitrous oxide reductase family maturation protein NosD [Anaerolineae bacterium]
MKRVTLWLPILILSFILLGLGASRTAASGSFDLQAAINAAAPGALIQVPAGLYRGNFVIDKPLTLVGIDWPVLDANGQGTVISIDNVPDVTVRGFVIRNSGTRLDKEDAGLSAYQAPGLVVEHNRLEDILFGIKAKDSAGSRIVANVIGAKPELEVAARGDSILVWYSHDSQIIGNEVTNGRDVVFWYNNGAVIRDNVISNNRYGLHFMYCDDALVENNRIEHNSVGAFLMYSRNLTLRQNIFAHNRGPSGYGIGLKDIDGVEATDNLFSANRVGMYFDNSPWSLDVSQHFSRNAFMTNDIGLLFAPSVKRNHFSQNSFIENGEQVGLTSGGEFKDNFFTVAGQGNFWSDYTGYDATGDGLGDLPYVSQSLFENMMDSHPALRLFQLSPAQQAIDLAARAFPIFQPKPKFSDEAPLMAPVLPAITPPPAGPTWPLWMGGLTLLAVAGLVVLSGSGRLSELKTARAVTKNLCYQKETPMIKVTGLTKRFGNFKAVDDLSFTVAPGEALALWGPNGAGKTTVIRSLLGLLSAEGKLLVNGYDAQTEGKKARAAIGYVPQELAFYDDLSARETLVFYARLKHVASERVDQVLAEVGLSAHGHKAVAALSGGMKQRLALAAALLADPPLLILDEPTSNLDTAARDDFIKLLLTQKARGKTLLFTSHRLEEVELLASRVLVLAEGRLKLSCDRPAELAKQLGMTMSLKIILPQIWHDNALDLLHQRGFSASRNGIGLRVDVSPSAKMAPLQALLAENIEVNNFEIENGW